MEGRLYQNYTTLKTCYPLPIKGLSDGKAALFYHFLYQFPLFRQKHSKIWKTFFLSAAKKVPNLPAPKSRM